MASNRKFMSALNALCEEKGIEKDVFLEMLKESIAKAYKKNYMVPEANVRVEINEKTGKIRLFEIRTVVDDLEDEDLEVSLDEAHDINPNYQVGDIVETEADVDHIGRLAAIQTKQLFRQKIRETEKETLYNAAYMPKEHRMAPVHGAPARRVRKMLIKKMISLQVLLIVLNLNLLLSILEKLEHF